MRTIKPKIDKQQTKINSLKLAKKLLPSYIEQDWFLTDTCQTYLTMVNVPIIIVENKALKQLLSHHFYILKLTNIHNFFTKITQNVKNPWIITLSISFTFRESKNKKINKTFIERFTHEDFRENSNECYLYLANIIYKNLSTLNRKNFKHIFTIDTIVTVKR